MTTEKLEPLVSTTDIYALLESICYDDATVNVLDAHRLFVILRDRYEAERQRDVEYCRHHADHTIVAELLIRIEELEAAAIPVLGWVDEVYPTTVFDGSSGDEGPVRIVAIRENLRKALLPKESE